MLSLRQNTICLSLALASLWACSDDDNTDDKTKSDAAAVEVGDAGDETKPDAGEPTGGNDKSILPIVFVHGFAGSASQFDSQAQRLVANGYPADKLSAFDHDGAGLDIPGFADQLDVVIEEVLKKFNVSQIYLIGHSRGTSVSNTYLENPERAKKIAKVVLLDGRPCGTIVPCDAPNQVSLPGQAHVEVATSKESFKRWYKFLFDKEATVLDIVKQDGPVEISGRAVNFPANTGRKGQTLEVYEVAQATGVRVGNAVKSFTIPESGEWGPVTVDPDKYYELVLTSETAGAYQHFYFQRFLRSTKFVRLLSGPPDSPSRVNTNAGPAHAALTLIRMREWYGPGTAGKTPDELKITVKGGPGGDVEVANAITPDVATNRIALYLHDDAATPKMTTLKPLPYFPSQPFQTGLDVYVPASDPPNATISVTNIQRGETGKPQVLNMPNFASDKHTLMVSFADFAQ